MQQLKWFDIKKNIREAQWIQAGSNVSASVVIKLVVSSN